MSPVYNPFLHPFPHVGGRCQRWSQPKDNFQAEEDKVHLEESTSKSDQQAAERAEKKQWVFWHLICNFNVTQTCLKE